MPGPIITTAGMRSAASGQGGSRAYSYFVSIVAATSGLLFGFDIAIINGALVFLRQHFHLNEWQTEVAASSLLFGCVLGAAIAGYLSDRFGRRWVLILSAVLFAVSAVGAALPRDLTEFLMARFVGGVGIGVASTLAPLYIAEVSPPAIRGRLVALNQMTIVSGILLAYFVSWVLAFQDGESWRWMFAAAVVPSIGFFVALFFVPESPRWLTENSRETEARRVLNRVLGEQDAGSAMQEIREAIAEESGTLRELLAPGYRKALAIAVFLAIFQQITGINTVLFYGSVIFEQYVGTDTKAAAIGANVIVGAVNFLATILALWLIDKVGRRPLLILSAALLAVGEIGLGLAFLQQPPPAMLVLGLMLLCVTAFAIGLGPGVWVVLAEIFPTRVRGRAMSIATICLWSACTALTMTFLSLTRAITTSGAFWLYAAMSVITAIVVWRVLPETKGKTLESIERLWKRHA